VDCISVGYSITFSLHCGAQKRQNPPREPRKATLLIVLATSTSLALAEDFKTVNGKEYKNATVTHVEADGIIVRTAGGISKIYFVELPKEVADKWLAPLRAAEQAAADKRIKEQQAAEEKRAAAERERADTA